MSEEGKNKDKERIAKVIARAGLCSRRDAERWILNGRISVNGEVLDSPACLIGSDDEVLIDGKPLPRAQKTRLFLHYKPAGLVTTDKDERGRKTVFDALPDGLPRLISVGRLDLNTEGLLLLTNDGELSRYLELPSTGWKRRYRVRAFGSVSESRLKSLKKGITVDGVKYKSITASIERSEGANSWLSISLTEGKNREIRKVLAALDLQVNRLIRIAYGPFQLGSMVKGDVNEVPDHMMRDQIRGFFK